MVDQNNRPKPAMGDIRPRRSMDMGRPSGAAPMPQQPVAPAQSAPIQRPQAIPQRPQPLPQRPVQRPMAAQSAPIPEVPVQAAPKAAKPPKVRKDRPFWRGFLQVIVSLLVIVGVAGVIVALYIRYYQ